MTRGTTTAPSAGGTPTHRAFDRRLYPPMILGAILNPINSSMIAVALIPIGAAFGAPVAQTAWLVSGLYLATAIGQPIVGRVVDAFGPRTVFLVGAALVGVAGLLGAFAPSLGVLIAARVLLGFGTCAGYPAAMHLIRSESRRTGIDSPAVVLTVLAVSTQTIAVIGPTLGGLLIDLGGWRAVFVVNVPLAAASFLLGALVLPRGLGASGPAPASGRRRLDLDVAGMALFAATVVALLLFLMHLTLAEWWIAAIAIAAGIGFAWRELAARAPFIDLRLLRGNPALLATYVRQLLSGIVSYAFLYGFTQWLESGYGLSPSGAGLVLLPLFAVAIGVTSLTGRRPQVRGKLVVGSIGQLLASAGLLLVGGSSPLWLLIAVVVVLGIPQGLNNLANQNALYHQADPERTASSAGLLRTFFYLGAIIASTANGLAFGHGADTAGLHDLSIFMVVVAALFLVLTLADRSLGRVGRDVAPVASAG